MKSNIIHKGWVSIDVPHNPNETQYIRCMYCGEVWASIDNPETCPHCGANLKNETNHS